MFRLAVFSLRHRALVVLLALAVAVVGLFGVIGLRRGLPSPAVAASVTVVASQPGADANRVYREVTLPLEAALRHVAGVADVSSSAQAGLDVTTLRLASRVTAEEARPRLVDALDQARGVLPAGVAPEVVADSAATPPVLRVAVAGQPGVSVNPAEITAVIEQALVPRLEALDGVGRVELVGRADPVVEIRLQPAAMGQYGVSAQQILSVLSDYGVSLTAGLASGGGQTMPVRVGSPIGSVDELKAIPLVVGSGAGTAPGQAGAAPRTVTLGMVTDVVQATDFGQAVRLCQLPRAPDQACASAVAVTVTAAPGGDVVALSRAVSQAVGAANATLGQSRLQARVLDDEGAAAGQAVQGLAVQGLIGLAAGVVVVGLLLRSPRAALIALGSLPVTLAVVLIVWRASGGTLNSLTAGALVFALARCLGDSAVVVESLRRHLARGLADHAAARAAVREVGGAVAAAAVCGAIVGTALGPVGGVPGELFFSFALTLVAGSLASGVAALTLVPVLTCRFVRPAPVVDEADAGLVRREAEASERRGWLARPHQAMVRGALAHPVIVVLLALALLAGTAWLGLRLKTDFLPGGDSQGLTVVITYPPNTSAAAVQQDAARVETALSGQGQYVTSILTVVSPTSETAAARAVAPTVSFGLTLDPAHAAGAAGAVRQAVAEVASGGRVTVVRAGAPDSAATVDLVIRSDDPVQLEAAVPRVRTMAAGLAGVSQVTGGPVADQSTLDLRIDRAKAAALGLTESQVATLVAAAASSTAIGHLTDPAGNPVAVTVALSAGVVASDDLMRLPVARDQAGPVALGSIAEATVVASPATITTAGGQRAATLSLAPADDDLGALRAEIRAGLAGLSLPAGVAVEVGGALGGQADAFRGLGWALLVVLLLVYLVAVAVGGSALRGLLTVSGLLLAAPGALAALLVTGQPLGVAALTGLFPLVGLVAAQSILATQLIDQQRPWGPDLRPAVVDGARVGLKPALALALGPGLALAPLALGLGGRDGWLVPLARVVVGGLISWTLLGLVVGPVLFSLWARGDDRRRQRGEDRRARHRRERAQRLGLPASPSEGRDALGNAGQSVRDHRAGPSPSPSDRVAGWVPERVAASPSESQRSGRGALDLVEGAAATGSPSPPASPSQPLDFGGAGERLRPPLFPPEEIEPEPEPTTAERLLGELSRADDSRASSPTTGERLRSPLFTPADMALPKTPVTALMTGLGGSGSTGSGLRGPEASAAGGALSRPGGATPGRTPASPGSPGLASAGAGRGGRQVAAAPAPVAGSHGPAAAGVPVSPVSSSSLSTSSVPPAATSTVPPVASSQPSSAVGAAPSGSPPSTPPGTPPVSVAPPAPPVLPGGSDGAAPTADPGLRPGPSGWPAVAPVRTLWPGQADEPAAFRGLSDEASSAADALFRRASPQGLSAVDRSVLSLAATVAVPPPLPPVAAPPQTPVPTLAAASPTPVAPLGPPAALPVGQAAGSRPLFPATSPAPVAPAARVVAPRFAEGMVQPPAPLDFPATPSEIARDVRPVGRVGSPRLPDVPGGRPVTSAADWEAGPTPPVTKPISEEWQDLPGPATSWPAWGSDA